MTVQSGGEREDGGRKERKEEREAKRMKRFATEETGKHWKKDIKRAREQFAEKEQRLGL